ncbi:mediator of RNA polymerase II transcription subunit 15a-like isoform X1 [Miscanthus floridulus]|uniref:mediator of RNA polymerase II transcription subunit 15a-like isoform X1 n=1 Tax=Miscanthus floridulus TaxID=154761 RepID=UPI00345AE2F4
MDGAANWRPTQGADPAAVAAAGGVDPNAAAPAGSDWRTQLQPEARHRIVNKIMETLKKHLPVSIPEGLTELHKIAVRFEEKIYTAATNQSDYLRKISLRMLSMESQTKTQQNPGNAQVIPNQNPPGPAPGLPPQGSNPAQSSAIPLMSQQQTRQPNASTSVQGSLPSLGQNLSSVSQTSTLQNLSGMPQNTMNNGLAQGTPQDMYAAQRQMAGRQQQQQQQQQAHNQLIYQQQKLLMNQKLQQNSLMQPHIQQQQTLLQSTQMQSSQQPMMQMSSGLQPGQTTIPQTQSMAMQSATQSGIQQNPLNSVQQSVQSFLQQPTQSVVRQQQHAQSMHQQPSLQQTQPIQQPNIPLQQQPQQLMGQQSNLQQNQLMNQQSGAVEMQQQQRLPVQSNNLLNMQQTQQMMNQQSMPLHQAQQLANQGNMSSLHQQQQQNLQQQQQLLGTAPNVRMHMLQQQKPIQQPQQQQHAQQTSMGLMQPQSQQNQLQQPQQHMMSQFQSQPNQVQQQLGMQQRLQTSAGMLLQQNNIDQQKQYVQPQRGLQEAPSTSVDSTAQTGHPSAGDLQEELYQMIKSLKDQYFAELNDLYNKISMKIQHIDNHMPAQMSAEQYEKMKGFKLMLERTLHFLQVNKSSIQPAFREKIPVYERQILSILSSQRRKPVQAPGQQTFQQSGGQAPSSNISQQHQTSQGLQQHDSHTNQMPQASLPSMNTGVQSSGAPGIQHVPAPQATNFGVPTTQQNVTNAPQAGSNLENAQGNNFNPVQHGSMGTALQQGSTGPMQGALNAQQQSSSNMISNNAMSTMQTNTNAMQANANSLQQLKQQHQEHQMMQSQQMKQRQQMMQQIQQKQMLQQQLPIQQLQKQQQQGQMPVPQLHSGNDVNELKVRQGAAIKSGMYQQLSQRNYYHQQIKQGGVFPISSPQNLQASSPQISHHSPQVDQHSLLQSQVKTGTPLHSANSPFVPSPSPPVAPSPMPVDSDKPLSNLSSLTSAGQAGHQQTSLAPQTQSIAVNTPGISASPLLAEFTSADGSQVNLPTQVPTKSAAERPLDRLLKALRTTQRESLSAAVSDIGSVVSMIDRIAGSAPGNGSRAAVGEDLVAMTKCRLQARNFITHDGSGASKKMKRDTSAMPLNVSSAGSVNDSLKQSYSVGTPELQSTATSRVKWQRAEVNHALMEEIQEINQQLIDTELHVSEDDAECFTTSEGGEGTVIRCTFTAVAVSPSLKSMFASAQMSPILPLRLLVPASYPKCSPVLLDKFPDEQCSNSDDLSTKAKSKFSVLLRGLAEPMSLREIARTWDACARKVIA